MSGQVPLEVWGSDRRVYRIELNPLGHIQIWSGMNSVSFPADILFTVLWNAATANALYRANHPPQDILENPDWSLVEIT